MSILIEEGTEALKRLMVVAQRDHGASRRVAAFLLGLYNGQRFPFDLTELRGLDHVLFEDCMVALRMDARACKREVHCYFDNGGALFEQLAARWCLLDVERLQNVDRTGVQTVVERVDTTLGECAKVKIASVSVAPGYRDVIATLEITPYSSKDAVRLEASIDRQSTEYLFDSIRDAISAAWRFGDPIDLQPGERRPSWLK